MVSSGKNENMKYFQKIAQNVNVNRLMHEIQRQPELWDENTLRTKHPGTAHSQVSDIWVWFNDTLLRQTDKEYITNDKEVISYRAWKLLPSLRPIIFDLMHIVQAVRLGRVIITKLPPGKEIMPHVDGGAPATYFQRYQLAMQCLPGNVFRIGDEEIGFQTGDIWHINNRVEHSVINNSNDDRIVCIVDLRCE